MSGTDSLSKGVFSFKKRLPSPSKSPRKRSKPSPPRCLRSLPFVYTDIRSITSGILSSVQASSFERVLREVLLFIDESLSTSKSSHRSLPTGVIVNGVNLPDHGDFFATLEGNIQSSGGKHVALVKSSSVTTLKALVGSIVRQLINLGLKEESQEEQLKRRDLLLPVFKDWFYAQYGSRDPSHPCVIIIEDFDSFNDHIAQELLYNIREFCGDLPIVLLLGVATSVDSVHRSLPTDLTSSLMIRKFSSQSSSQTFAEVVERVIICNKDIPFKLGGKVFRLLYDIFLFHDFSIKNFLSGYKFCLLEHMSSPIGGLLKRSISQLSHEEIEVFRRCLSFRGYVEEDIPARAALLIDDEQMKTCLKECLRELESSTDRFNLGCRAAFAIVTNLQRNPIGKYLHSIYMTALSEDFCQTSEFKEMFQLLSLVQKTDLESIIQKVLEILEGNPSESSIITELQSYLVKLGENKLTESQSQEPKESLSSSSPQKKAEPAATTEFKTRFSRSQWQESLKENMLKEKTRIATVFECIRSDVLSSLRRYFEGSLKRPNTLPFHEVKFFNNSAAVRRHLIGEHRISIQTALTHPGDYLKSKDLSKVEKFEIPPILPDISIAYKLYSECGKLINLYDWLQCWLSVIKGDNQEKDENTDEVLQARFTQAVAELQFLGFIKSSKRKTDHVSRLTWGAY